MSLTTKKVLALAASLTLVSTVACSSTNTEHLLVSAGIIIISASLFIFGGIINKALGNIKSKSVRDAIVAISVLARDAVHEYALEHPEHEWPKIPAKLLTELINRLRKLKLANKKHVAKRALSSAAFELHLNKLKAKHNK